MLAVHFLLFIPRLKSWALLSYFTDWHTTSFPPSGYLQSSARHLRGWLYKCEHSLQGFMGMSPSSFLAWSLALEPNCQHLNPDWHSLPVWFWARYPLECLCFSSSFIKQESYLQALNELIYVWHLEQCLTFGKYSVNVSFHHYYIILIRLETPFQKPSVCKLPSTQIIILMFY